MKRYVIAKYIRLSLEDTKYDSLSIENQRLVIDTHIAGMPESDCAEILEFVDNGYSGTNFERPEVQRLIELVRSNRVDCIIVKDFSRFGRNSIETGYFIERVFPLFHTRFIAIGDGFDTDEHRGDTGGLEVAFKYLINEQYSRDMSIKCKSAKYAKMRRGEYQSKECIFGYRKGADGKLEPDPDQAPVVRLIFELAASGMGFTAIAAELTKRRIPTPGEVKAAKGNGTYDVSRCNGRWNTSTVIRILDDERFLGHYVQGVRTVTEIGGHRIRKKAKDKWFFVPDHHEPIVAQKLFDKAHEGQRRFNQANRKSRNTPLCGKVICGCCNHALSYYPKKNPVYTCRVSRMDETLACYGFQIPVSDVLETVFNVVRQQLMAAVPVTTDGEPCLSLIDIYRQQYETQVAEIMESKRLMYEQLIAGEIEADAFQQGKSSLDEMLAKTKSTFAAMKTKVEEKQTAENRQQQRRQILADMQAEGTFSNELAEQIIDRILIYPDKRIEIVYKVADLFA